MAFDRHIVCPPAEAARGRLDQGAQARRGGIADVDAVKPRRASDPDEVAGHRDAVGLSGKVRRRTGQRDRREQLGSRRIGDVEEGDAARAEGGDEQRPSGRDREVLDDPGQDGAPADLERARRITAVEDKDPRAAPQVDRAPVVNDGPCHAAELGDEVR